MQELFHFRVGFPVGAHLGADLHAFLVLARGIEELLAFPEREAERFFDVHVLAGLHRPDPAQAVPVVRRGDDHRVDFGIVEHLARVGEGLGGIERFFALVEPHGVHLTDPGELVRFTGGGKAVHDAAVFAAFVAVSEDTDADLFIRTAGDQSGGGKNGRGSQRRA